MSSIALDAMVAFQHPLPLQLACFDDILRFRLSLRRILGQAVQVASDPFHCQGEFAAQFPHEAVADQALPEIVADLVARDHTAEVFLEDSDQILLLPDAQSPGSDLSLRSRGE